MYPTMLHRNTLVATILLALPKQMVAQSTMSKYKAYPLFVFNFTKYIHWPEGAIKDDFVIGVYGNSSITEELEKMGTFKKAGDKTIRVVVVNDLNNVADTHILFIPDEKSGRIADILSSIRGKPVLVIGERQGLYGKVAGISFFSDEKSLKFELNSLSLSNQNLKFSNQLLVLARSHKGS